MSKGTKAFRITISILLALCILLIACLIHDVYYLDVAMSDQENYGISVAGIAVTKENKDDILGDGTVFYDPDNSTLVFADAEIKTDQSIIVSNIDLGICLLGENKFISSSTDSLALISVVNYHNAKDLYIYGDGSLTIEYLNSCTDSVVLQCDDLTVLSDITLTTPDCTSLSNGIVCDSSFKLLNGASVTVNGSSAKSLVAFRVRGNMLLDANTAVNVNVENGSAEAAKGLTVSGDLILGNGASVNVSVEEDSAKTVECLRVNGLIEVGTGATLTATTTKSYAVEGYGAVKLCDDAVLSATSKESDIDIICHGAVTNYGATVNGEMEVLGQLYDKSAE
jgi:hypothetical protein